MKINQYFYFSVKGVNFFGPKSEFVISGSDCGNIYIWDKETESIVQFMRGDEDGVVRPCYYELSFFFIRNLYVSLENHQLQ